VRRIRAEANHSHQRKSALLDRPNPVNPVFFFLQRRIGQDSQDSGTDASIDRILAVRDPVYDAPAPKRHARSRLAKRSF
jgi:hypothetical protein